MTDEQDEPISLETAMVLLRLGLLLAPDWLEQLQAWRELGFTFQDIVSCTVDSED